MGVISQLAAFNIKLRYIGSGNFSWVQTNYKNMEKNPFTGISHFEISDDQFMTITLTDTLTNLLSYSAKLIFLGNFHINAVNVIDYNLSGFYNLSSVSTINISSDVPITYPFKENDIVDVNLLIIPFSV